MPESPLAVRCSCHSDLDSRLDSQNPCDHRQFQTKKVNESKMRRTMMKQKKRREKRQKNSETHEQTTTKNDAEQHA